MFFSTKALSGRLKSRVCLVLMCSFFSIVVQAQIANPSFDLPSNQWTQIVVPGTLPSGSNTVGNVFGASLDTSLYETQWAVFGYQPALGTYETMSLSEPLESARAYWIIHVTDQPVTIELPPGTVEPVGTENAISNYVIAASIADDSPFSSNVGWAMIGKPGTLQSRLEDLRLITDAPGPCNSDTPCAIATAFELGFASNIFFGYNPMSGDYDIYSYGSELPDWQGFWYSTATARADLSGAALEFPALAPTTNSFDDEFDAPTLAGWELRHLVENTTPQFTLLDVDNSAPGALAIVPTRTPGWFASEDAPLVFKQVTGNFSVETSVSAHSTNNPGNAPQSNYNSAGLMARNPSGATESENYIMVNVGQQNGFPGSETKTTQNSSSVLELIPGSTSGRLTLCRIGTTFYAYRWLDNEDSWTSIGSFSRPDLPITVQVGMIANAFTGPDIRAEFDYIRLRIPQSEAQCTAD